MSSDFLHSRYLPAEYRQPADALFPESGFLSGGESSINAAVNFARLLEVGEDYRRLLDAGKNSREFAAYLEYFQNNMDLMIQKTWVEKAEEGRKEKLQDRIPRFIDLVEEGEYFQALQEFGGLLTELAYLFFGSQSLDEGFAEYAFRVDEQMGLFFWYGGKLGQLREQDGKDGRGCERALFAVLLLGICYVANF